MIPQELEKLILRGKAQYSIHNLAYSSFGRIPIPSGKLAIIVSIKWNHFFNPYSFAAADLMVNALKWNQFQLKVDSKKSKNYFIYANGFFPNPVATLTPTTTVSSYFASRSWPFELLPPDNKDTYLVCTDYIKLTVTRVMIPDSNSVSIMGNVSAAANEEDMPNGVKNATVLLRYTGNGVGIANNVFTPAGNLYAGQSIPADRSVQNFNAPIGASAILKQPNDAQLIANFNYPYATQPFVEFGVVLINTNEYDNLLNS